MPCEHCDCPDCEEAREQEQVKAELKKLCDSWNWNAHPIEVARELQEHIDNGRFTEDDAYDALVEYFNRETADEVMETMDYL